MKLLCNYFCLSVYDRVGYAHQNCSLLHADGNNLIFFVSSQSSSHVHVFDYAGLHREVIDKSCLKGISVHSPAQHNLAQFHTVSEPVQSRHFTHEQCIHGNSCASVMQVMLDLQQGAYFVYRQNDLCWGTSWAVVHPLHVTQSRQKTGTDFLVDNSWCEFDCANGGFDSNCYKVSSSFSKQTAVTTQLSQY